MSLQKQKVMGRREEEQGRPEGAEKGNLGRPHSKEVRGEGEAGGSQEDTCSPRILHCGSHQKRLAFHAMNLRVLGLPRIYFRDGKEQVC